MASAVLIVCGIISGATSLYWLYFVITSLPLTRLPAPPDPETDRVRRFAVLIFGRNEAAVIGQLVESLRDQDYPADSFDIFVTADNCTDDTAIIAAEAGAIVWERFDTERTGKGAAMRWFFERFRLEEARNYDACAVFDADNVVDPGFLAAMNRHLNRGNDIAIGYRLSKNPSDSAVASASALFWLAQARFILAPRTRRGVPCPSVGGPGFAFDLSVLPDGLWPTKSPFEDIEFTLLSIAAGRTVSFTYDAVFYDEQPVTWWQSTRQRYRWNVDILLMLKYGTPFLLRTFRERWRKSYDAVIFSLGGAASALGFVIGPVMTILAGITLQNWGLVIASTIFGTAVSYAISCGISWLVLKLEGQWWDRAWSGILIFPFYMWTTMALAVVAVFYRTTRPSSTPHTASMTLQDVLRAQSLARGVTE